MSPDFNFSPEPCKNLNEINRTLLYNTMDSSEKLFTIDELLYYTKFAIDLYCDKQKSNEILHSLSNDLIGLNMVSPDKMNAALIRNDIDTPSVGCERCMIVKPADPLLPCPSCKKLVHSMCFWKPGAYCNRACRK